MMEVYKATWFLIAAFPLIFLQYSSVWAWDDIEMEYGSVVEETVEEHIINPPPSFYYDAPEYEPSVNYDAPEKVPLSEEENETPWCSWSINGDLPINQPLYINPAATQRDMFGLHLPQTSDKVSLPHGTKVKFACPGGFLNGFNNKREMTLECDENFRYRDPETNKIYYFQYLYCSDLPRDEVLTVSDDCHNGLSGNQYSLNRVGYKLQDNTFYYVYQFCFDHDSNDAIFAFFRLSKHIAGSEKNFLSTGFIQHDSFYPRNIIKKHVDTLYTQRSQLDTFTRILGSPKLAQDILEPGTDFYLARGHLAAKAYFVYYGTQQASTHWFMNAIPQFATANSGNWKNLETQIRNFAISSQRILDIFVGSTDVFKYLDVNDTIVSINLFYDSDNETCSKRIKVPEKIWTLMYDGARKEGVVFVMMNTGDRPVYDDDDPFAGFCVQVCELLPWLNWPDHQDNILGYGTCCTVDSVIKKIPEMPRGLDVSGGLLTTP